MLDKQLIGWTSSTSTVEVEKGRVRFFAHAIGETNPLYSDEEVARAEGYRSIPIPPTFLFCLEGEQGFLGLEVPEVYGGMGLKDAYSSIMGEELAHFGVLGACQGILLHNDIVLPYLLAYASAEQKQRWLPGICTGTGYGYMLEYPIAHAYLDARAQSIYAGINEIMKEIIGRSMGV